jgi:replicative DNA helicase
MTYQTDSYIETLDSIKNRIRPRLRSFLEETGNEISSTGMFHCINKMHDDSSASCRLLPDLNYEQYYCYGCAATGDIFCAHSILKDAPTIGLEFVEQNVYKLADKYDILFTPIEWTTEQLEKMAQASFVRTVTTLMNIRDDKGDPINWTSDPAVTRDWSWGTLLELNISTIKDLSKFIEDIQKTTGLTKQEVKDRGVTKALFGPDRLTMTLQDHKGNPVGFTARNLTWAKGSKAPKYCNSTNSILFKKADILHGMHIARKQKHRTLDLLEGNADFVTAYQYGHRACVGIGGTSLTDEQVNMIMDIGFTSVNLVFDGDTAGAAAMDKYMEKLSGNEGLSVTVTKIPDQLDPDEFIKTYGIGKFYKLKTTNAFDFFLEKEEEKGGRTDKLKFTTKMIKLIQNTENRISRGEQIKSLSIFVNVPETDIRDELERLTRLDTNDIKRALERSLRGANDIDDITQILEKQKEILDGSAGSREERIRLSVLESVDAFDNLCTILVNRKPGIQGWKTGFPVLDYKLSGIPKPVGEDDDGSPIPVPGTIIGIGGAPQHGKSSILTNIALGVARNNDDVCILYWSLDDSRERTFERMIAMMSGVPLYKVTRKAMPDPGEVIKMNIAINELREMMNQGKMVLKDHKTGSTIPMLKRWITLSREVINKPILIVIDSFYKMSPSSDEGNKTDFAVTKAHSQQIKTLAQTHNVSIMSSLELNKGQGQGMEPQLNHITEARKIEYDFDIIALVYNQFYDLDGETNNIMPDGRPLIKFNIKKTKEGGAGVLWAALDPNDMSIEFYAPEEIAFLSKKEEVKDTDMGGGVTLVPIDKGTMVTLPWDK